jgi:hypothetical protein
MDSIFLLFEKVENKHGWLLVSHALAYVTAAKSGVSETELEDLISLDDKVLDDIYQYHLPPVRRIPPLLWTRYFFKEPRDVMLGCMDAKGMVVILIILFLGYGVIYQDTYQILKLMGCLL